MATIDELLEEAGQRDLSREDVILALRRVIEHNEGYRRSRTRRRKRRRTATCSPRRSRRWHWRGCCYRKSKCEGQFALCHPQRTTRAQDAPALGQQARRALEQPDSQCNIGDITRYVTPL